VEFNRFDISAKELVWDDPAAWLERFGIGPPGPVEVIDSDIHMPDGWQTNRYNYRVVRVWAEDPEPYLTAGVNLVPLAPLANVTVAALPGLVQRMAGRINAEPPPRAAKLWTATYLLMGLCYSEELVSRLLEGAQNMQDSSTYQAILREDRISGERRMLFISKTRHFFPERTFDP